MTGFNPLFLHPSRLTLAVAESLTCGRVQALAAAESGASEFFLGGITAYSLDQKVRHLGVNRAMAQKVDSVSALVAEQMAVGVCQLFGSDLGLATTGWAEAAPAKGIVTPFAWWGLAHRRKGQADVIRSGRLEWPALSRREAQARAAELAIEALAQYVRSFRQSAVTSPRSVS